MDYAINNATTQFEQLEQKRQIWTDSCAFSLQTSLGMDGDAAMEEANRVAMEQEYLFGQDSGKWRMPAAAASDWVRQMHLDDDDDSREEEVRGEALWQY